MSGFIPDPNNYVMKANPKKPLEAHTNALPQIDTSDPKALEKLCMDELAAIVQKNRGQLAGVPAIRELLDRIKGKPGQQVTVDANMNIVTVNASVQFIQSTRDKVITGGVDNVQVIENE